MLAFLILLILPSNISAKLYPTNSEDDLDISKSDSDVEYITGDPLWVLNLNNEEWLDAKLQLGTFAEEEDFYETFGHLKRDIKQFPRAKKDDPEKPKIMPPNRPSTRSNEDIKKDIMKIINKFALSTSIEPDVYITENIDDHNPSIKLYFKGPASCLIVKQGVKEWHYVIKSAPFPSWFYERHDTFEAPLEIPNEVKNAFLSALLRFLKLVLSYPI